MLTHLPRQVVMGRLTLPVCPLFHCLLLQISASSQIWHKIGEIFEEPSIRPWPPILLDLWVSKLPGRHVHPVLKV